MALKTASEMRQCAHNGKMFTLHGERNVLCFPRSLNEVITRKGGPFLEVQGTCLVSKGHNAWIPRTQCLDSKESSAARLYHFKLLGQKDIVSTIAVKRYHRMSIGFSGILLYGRALALVPVLLAAVPPSASAHKTCWP